MKHIVFMCSILLLLIACNDQSLLVEKKVQATAEDPFVISPSTTIQMEGFGDEQIIAAVYNPHGTKRSCKMAAQCQRIGASSMIEFRQFTDIEPKDYVNIYLNLESDLKDKTPLSCMITCHLMDENEIATDTFQQQIRILAN